MMPDSVRAFGGPVLAARFRVRPEDFVVEEELGFAADGEGEHLLLRVEKRGANSAFVAAALARWAGVPLRAVGYAGRKDRHAVARQSFSVHLPGKACPTTLPEHPDYRVLECVRHRRKLQRGALRGNRFELVLREVRGAREAIEERLRYIAAEGFPNGFGSQRFGRDGGNLELARALFAGRRMGREKASMALSAARAAAFNAVLAARLREGCWNTPVDGEVFMLDASRSVFGPEPLTEALCRRCREGDIHPTGPLWGQGEPRTVAQALDFDRAAAEVGADLLAGLARAGLVQERRPLRVRPRGLAWSWPAADTLRIAFALPAGAYATALLHELGMTEDAAAGSGEALAE